MRSLYVKLSLWSLATLIFCVAVFIITATSLNRNLTSRGGPMEKTFDQQAALAHEAYERGGKEELRALLQQLKRFFPEAHWMEDREGRDLITGEKHPEVFGKFRLMRESRDGKYQYVTELDPPINTQTSLPYFAAVLVAIAVLSYALFRYLVRPLHELAEAVERFGQGDLSARVAVKRSDEFGEVAQQFNSMAEQIESLLEDVSHELQSPLARMQFALEIPNREMATAKVRKEIERLSTLVSHLLEVTRAQSREKTKVDLSRLASEVVADCRIEAQAKECQLEWETVGTVEVMGDAELLRRCVENVLRNAIRYAPSGTSVRASLQEGMGKAVLIVRDQGPGVPEDMLERIFQPFVRVDSSRTTATGGVGLGLAIVKRAVGLHRGEVRAENAAPGLRVRVELPLD